jgi:RHS repeat-associated protein
LPVRGSHSSDPSGPYGYDANGNLSTTSLGGSLVQGTTWDINGPLPQAAEDTSSTGSTTADYLYGAAGTLASMTIASGTYQAATDWLGSVTGMISSAGTQVTSTTYSPYGTPSTSGTTATSIGYAGSYSLPGSSLDDMRARDYNLANGTFTSVDPLLDITGQPYAYASDDPVSQTDPDGLLGVGGCLSGAAIFGIELFTSGCEVATLNLSTGTFQPGYTKTGGVGTGIPSIGYLVGPEITNANSIAELGGPFAQVGGSGEIASLSAGGDFAIGLDQCGHTVWTAFGGAGQGLDLPWVAAGFEIHGGVTDTLTTTALSFNLYDFWDRFTSVFP